MIAEVTVRFRSLAIFNLTAIVVLNYQNDDSLFSREGGYATQSQTGRELKKDNLAHRFLINNALLCNDSVTVDGKEIGDPTEVALVNRESHC